MYGSAVLGLVLVMVLSPPGGDPDRAPGVASGDTLFAPVAVPPAPLAVRPAPRVRFAAAEIPRGVVALERGARPLVADTPGAPPPLIEYSDAYFTRLQIHRWASWAILPVFALQYASGQQLADKGGAAPGWARNLHGPAAAGVATLFGVNTVTGVWNMWEARNDPYGRGWRNAHSLLMLLADAGFVATGMLAEEAEEGGSADTHRSVAMASMGVALASWVMMLPPFRRD